MMATNKLYGNLDEAREAAGRGRVVVRLAPLARWIVVDAAEALAFTVPCGWEVER